MKYALGILNWIKANKLTAIFIAAFGLASVLLIINAKGKAIKCEDCQPYKEMTSQLLDALKNAPTSYEPIQSNYHYAVFKEPTLQQVLSSLSGDDRTQTIDNGVYVETWNWGADTTKPMTQAQWNKYKDSVIIATQKKLDSLKKQKN